MTKQNTKSKKGFTIIEVVLVLAIAGLIFLMVFIAYPALRRSQSDTQRREDMSRALSQLTSYIANNRKQPTNSTQFNSFFSSYLTNTSEGFNDPDGNRYVAAFMGKCVATGTASCFTAYNNGGSSNLSVNRDTDLGKNFGGALGNNGANNGNAAYRVFYFYHARCAEGQDFPTVGKGDKEVAITYKLEGGGWYCGSNSN